MLSSLFRAGASRHASGFTLSSLTSSLLERSHAAGTSKLFTSQAFQHAAQKSGGVGVVICSSSSTAQSPLVAAGLRRLATQQQHNAGHAAQQLRQLATAGPKEVAHAAAAGSSTSALSKALQGLKGVTAAARSAANAAAKARELMASRLPAGPKRVLDAVRQPGSGLHRVLSLQLEAFWQHHGRKVMAVGGVFLVYFLWKIMYGTASAFINLSQTMATGGFLALAAAIVSFFFLYLRNKYTVDPNAVYRLAMIKLNTHPGILEVMGAPLAGSEVRAAVLTGGRLKLKSLRPKFQSRRIQMMFPLKGTERRGLVSLEAKKRRGRYEFKLLAVDVPSYSGGEQRIFLEGGPRIYERGGVLNELRDPFVRAMSCEEMYLIEDEADDAAAAAAQEQEEQRVAAEQALQADAQHEGNMKTMHFYERLYFRFRDVVQGATKAAGGSSKIDPPRQAT